METGVYKIWQKKNPKNFNIVGIVSIDHYWKQYGNKDSEYSLIWACNKINLDRFTKHFTEKYHPTWDNEKVEAPVEKAVIKEPVMEKAIIPEKIEPITQEKDLSHVLTAKPAKKKVVRKKK
jgi:hypothetical protein